MLNETRRNFASLFIEMLQGEANIDDVQAFIDYMRMCPEAWDKYASESPVNQPRGPVSSLPRTTGETDNRKGIPRGKSPLEYLRDNVSRVQPRAFVSASRGDPPAYRSIDPMEDSEIDSDDYQRYRRTRSRVREQTPVKSRFLPIDQQRQGRERHRRLGRRPVRRTRSAEPTGRARCPAYGNLRLAERCAICDSRECILGRYFSERERRNVISPDTSFHPVGTQTPTPQTIFTDSNACQTGDSLLKGPQDKGKTDGNSLPVRPTPRYPADMKCQPGMSSSEQHSLSNNQKIISKEIDPQEIVRIKNAKNIKKSSTKKKQSVNNGHSRYDSDDYFEEYPLDSGDDYNTQKGEFFEDSRTSESDDEMYQISPRKLINPIEKPKKGVKWGSANVQMVEGQTAQPPAPPNISALAGNSQTAGTSAGGGGGGGGDGDGDDSDDSDDGNDNRGNRRPNRRQDAGDSGNEGDGEGDNGRQPIPQLVPPRDRQRPFDMSRAISQLVSLGMTTYTGGLKPLLDLEERLERYCYANNISDRNKYLLFTVFLQGTAYKFFQKYLQYMERKEEHPSYRSLMKLFKKKYMQPSDRYQMNQRLYTLYQKKKESVDSYVERFEELAQHVDLGEEQAMHIFCKGLVRPIAKHMWDVFPPKTLDQAVKRAQNIEQSRRMASPTVVFHDTSSSSDSDFDMPSSKKKDKKKSKEQNVEATVNQLRVQVASLQNKVDDQDSTGANLASQIKKKAQFADEAKLNNSIEEVSNKAQSGSKQNNSSYNCSQCGDDHDVRDCPTLEKSQNRKNNKNKGKNNRNRSQFQGGNGSNGNNNNQQRQGGNRQNNNRKDNRGGKQNNYQNQNQNQNSRNYNNKRNQGKNRGQGRRNDYDDDYYSDDHGRGRRDDDYYSDEERDRRPRGQRRRPPDRNYQQDGYDRYDNYPPQGFYRNPMPQGYHTQSMPYGNVIPHGSGHQTHTVVYQPGSLPPYQIHPETSYDPFRSNNGQPNQMPQNNQQTQPKNV